MKTFNLVCAGLALSGFIVSAILWRDLHAQRELMAEWQHLHPAAAESVPVQSRALPAQPDTPPAQTQTGTANTDSVVRHDTPSIAEQMARDRERFNDPEYRRYALSRYRLMATQNYPGLAEALGLSTTEASGLFDLLAEQQLELTSQLLMASGGGTADPVALRDMVRGRQEMQRRHEESLTSLLGDARYRKWQEYKDNRSAQQQVEGLYRPAMKTLGQPLSETQVQLLSVILVGEQKRRRQEMQSMRGIASEPRPGNMEQLQDELAGLHKESVERIIAAARGGLTAQQLESLRAVLDRHATALPGSIRPH